jgi:hypothetical protein
VAPSGSPRHGHGWQFGPCPGPPLPGRRNAASSRFGEHCRFAASPPAHLSLLVSLERVEPTTQPSEIRSPVSAPAAIGRRVRLGAADVSRETLAPCCGRMSSSESDRRRPYPTARTVRPTTRATAHKPMSDHSPLCRSVLCRSVRRERWVGLSEPQGEGADGARGARLRLRATGPTSLT